MLNDEIDFVFQDEVMHETEMSVSCPDDLIGPFKQIF